MGKTVQIHPSRQYAKAFCRGVYADILRWGDSEMLTKLCRTHKHKSDETYMDCLHWFYASMKANYRCEYVFKNEIIAELRKHYAHRQSLAVNEFRVGNSIVDLAFFNGESRAYEIKTGYDSPRRLEGQMNDYKRVFDKCYLVVEQDEVDNWLDYDKDVGIIAFCHSPRGKIELQELRPAQADNQIDVDVLMTCLRAEEYEYMAEHYACASLSESKYLHFEECRSILRTLERRNLHRAFLETIEKRKSNFDVLAKTPRELYQICLSMHLSVKQLDLITKSLNNNII
ncbi:MAG: sce7726 family protein [Candidatus Cryptobacteroides sp.]